jgi:hypothetical protein
MLRTTFGPERKEVAENGENCILSSFILISLVIKYKSHIMKETERNRACSMPRKLKR